MALPIQFTLAAVSGVALVVFGAALLALRPRGKEALFFALFSICWGAQVMVANLADALGRPLWAVRFSILGLYAIYPLMILFLGRFLALLHWGRVRGWLTGVSLAIAVAGVVVRLARPEWILIEATYTGDSLSVITGPAAVPLYIVPFRALLYSGLAIAAWRYFRSPAGSPRRDARAFLMALGFYVGYETTRDLLFFSATQQVLVLFQDGSTIALITTLALGLALHLGIAARLLGRPVGMEELDLRLFLALLVPVAAATVEHVIRDSITIVYSVGFWRVAAMGVLALALARRDVFDLEIRAQRGAPAALATLFLAVGFGLAGLWLLDGKSLLWSGASVAGSAALSSVVMVGRHRLEAQLGPTEHQRDAFLYQRKLDVYRASLERALTGGSGDPDRELQKLRRSLGISDREHQVMAYMVRQTVGRSGQPVNQEPRSAPGAHLMDRYRVERLLGEGAHGRAYLAHDEKLDRDVVVKSVGTAAFGGRAAKLLMREARIAGSIRHPNIISIYDMAEGAQEALIVMEYADGGNLHGLLQRRGRMEAYSATAILDQMLSGLEAAHAKSVVHRDIKPENILLTKGGAIKLADFGVAREARPDATGLEGGALGTLLYMSPEQVRGLPADARSDLYAVGVVFYQLLTSRFYLRIAGCDDFQLRQLILEADPDLDLAGQPAWVRPFLLRALAKDVEERFQSASEMRATLQTAAAGDLARGMDQVSDAPSAAPA